MNSRKILATAILGAMASVSTAQAAGSFSIVGAANRSTTSLSGATTTTTYDPQFGFGGGILFEAPLGQKAGLEVGGIYEQRKTKVNLTSTNNFVSTMTVVDIPVLFRFHFNRVFSLGLGGYYITGLGDVKQTDATTAANNGSFTYAQEGFTKSDYGAMASLGFTFPMGKSASLLIDARYKMGLKNTLASPPAGVSQKFNDMQALVGIRFGGMK